MIGFSSIPSVASDSYHSNLNRGDYEVQSDIPFPFAPRRAEVVELEVAEPLSDRLVSGERQPGRWQETPSTLPGPQALVIGWGCRVNTKKGLIYPPFPLSCHGDISHKTTGTILISF